MVNSDMLKTPLVEGSRKSTDMHWLFTRIMCGVNKDDDVLQGGYSHGLLDYLSVQKWEDLTIVKEEEDFLEDLLNENTVAKKNSGYGGLFVNPRAKDDEMSRTIEGSSCLGATFIAFSAHNLFTMNYHNLTMQKGRNTVPVPLMIPVYVVPIIANVIQYFFLYYMLEYVMKTHTTILKWGDFQTVMLFVASFVHVFSCFKDLTIGAHLMCTNQWKCISELEDGRPLYGFPHEGIPRWIKCVIFCNQILIPLIVMVLGTAFLATSEEFNDLVMNSAGLYFLIELDEMFLGQYLENGWKPVLDCFTKIEAAGIWKKKMSEAAQKINPWRTGATQQRTVHLKIISSKNLKKPDSSDVEDVCVNPCVCVYAKSSNKQLTQTVTEQNSQNPRWEDDLQFSVPCDLQLSVPCDETTLLLRVLNDSKDVLGEAELSLDGGDSRGCDRALTFQGESPGEITVHLEDETPSDGDVQVQKAESQEMMTIKSSEAKIAGAEQEAQLLLSVGQLFGKLQIRFHRDWWMCMAFLEMFKPALAMYATTGILFFVASDTSTLVKYILCSFNTSDFALSGMELNCTY